MLTNEISEVKKGCKQRTSNGVTFCGVPYGYTNMINYCELCQAKLSTLKSAQAKFDKFVEDLHIKIDKFQKELLEIVNDCMNDWSYIENKYNEKFKELKDELSSKQEGKETECDCKMFIGGSGELCPECKTKVNLNLKKSNTKISKRR